MFKKLLVFLVVLAGVLAVIGSGTNSANYQTPQEKEDIVLNFTLNEPLEKVWERTTRSVAGTFFVVNNIETASHFINLSYSGSADAYVDCGTLNYKIGNKNYTYSGSEPLIQFYGIGLCVQDYTREVNLTGRMNILLQELSPQKTFVQIKVRYIIERKTTVTTRGGGTCYNLNYQYYDKVSFDSNGKGVLPKRGQDENPPTTCIPNGNLEEEIISLITNGF